MTFKPLLCPIDDPLRNPRFLTDLQFPLICFPKVDGIRGLTPTPGVVSSRSGKPIPSAQVQLAFSDLHGLDGELIIGDWTDPDVYNRTQSHVMSFDKPGDLYYYVFDSIHPDDVYKPFYKRYEALQKRVKAIDADRVRIIEGREVDTLEELLEYEAECLALGFEGIIMRNPVGEYKNGRATYKQSIIYKLKRFTDAEAPIKWLEERMINNNEQTRDELGFATRSSSKEGLIPAGTTGKYIVDFEGNELDVAPGQIDHATLLLHWGQRDSLKGRLLKFRYFGHGIKDLPRFPRALGLRSDIDL